MSHARRVARAPMPDGPRRRRRGAAQDAQRATLPRVSAAQLPLRAVFQKHSTGRWPAHIAVSTRSLRAYARAEE